VIDQLLYLLLGAAGLTVAFYSIDRLFPKKDKLGIDGKLV